VQVITLHEAGQRGSALASAIMEHAGSLVSLAGEGGCVCLCGGGRRGDWESV